MSVTAGISSTAPSASWQSSPTVAANADGPGTTRKAYRSEFTPSAAKYSYQTSKPPAAQPCTDSFRHEAPSDRVSVQPAELTTNAGALETTSTGFMAAAPACYK